MEIFDSVVVAYDPTAFDLAMPIRGMLELYRLYVHMYYCCQKRNILDVLTGKIPKADYVVLVGHGAAPEEVARGGAITFMRPADEIEGTWQEVDFRLFPEDVPQFVNLKGRVVISLGCNSGHGPLARAFLDAGCRAYIGPAATIDQNSTTLFACTFFHYMMAEPPDRLAEREAFERARQIDSQAANYRYYRRD